MTRIVITRKRISRVFSYVELAFLIFVCALVIFVAFIYGNWWYSLFAILSLTILRPGGPDIWYFKKEVIIIDDSGLIMKKCSPNVIPWNFVISAEFNKKSGYMCVYVSDKHELEKILGGGAYIHSDKKSSWIGESIDNCDLQGVDLPAVINEHAKNARLLDAPE